MTRMDPGSIDKTSRRRLWGQGRCRGGVAPIQRNAFHIAQQLSLPSRLASRRDGRSGNHPLFTVYGRPCTSGDETSLIGVDRCSLYCRVASAQNGKVVSARRFTSDVVLVLTIVLCHFRFFPSARRSALWFSLSPLGVALVVPLTAPLHYGCIRAALWRHLTDAFGTLDDERCLHVVTWYMEMRCTRALCASANCIAATDRGRILFVAGFVLLRRRTFVALRRKCKE